VQFGTKIFSYMRLAGNVASRFFSENRLDGLHRKFKA